VAASTSAQITKEEEDARVKAHLDELIASRDFEEAFNIVRLSSHIPNHLFLILILIFFRCFFFFFFLGVEFERP